ncbi:LysR family transcriptional regulator [Pseudomonas sp. HMWF032]|uniref:LysR substrate-binding domain-containing protein n=1 Tax=unclassified Pseudomonas TaxID=196821 RepID=UPI000D3325A9|nr:MULTISPECIES: LysR substrate-binding domain-containing protein [unclassified Pseudomonas]PTS86849.1 LysR family transcriptional regulator [Pseudomonas sp. HMWF032]PTT82455.1 LysR family transcriptional regulator [Pseudomonas sp. HMWF010]WAC44514.1 LysR substrate-binding domain-containing protein [Pseudomonas sp. SL4(2022)]
MKTTLDELLAFVRVVDSGSISAAAEQLAQTASGVSRALSRLEEKLAVTLLRRTTRRLELTEEGAVFLVQARKILDAVDSAEEQMKVRRQKPAGRLRVNAAAAFMLHAVVPLVAGFRERYPDIQLELHSSDQIIDLLEQRTDVAIRIGLLRDSTLHARPLGANRLRVLASPTYLAAHGMPHGVEELSQHSLLGFTQPESLNQWPLRHALGDAYSIAPSLSASSGETLRQLALAGAGIVCLADFMTAADRASGELVQLLVSDTVEVLQPIHAVYYRNTALASRITCFLDYLSSQLST